MLLVLTSVLTELLANIMIEFGLSNLVVYNSYTIVNLNLVFFIYLSTFSEAVKPYLKAFLIAANVFALLNALLLQPFTSYNSNLLVTVSIILLLLALSYFNRLIREVKYHKLERDPMFWLSAGIIMYYSGTLVLFFLSNQVSVSDDPNADLLFLASWGLNSIFNLMLITSYTITLWVKAVK